jgi:hypothetical protein
MIAPTKVLTAAHVIGPWINSMVYGLWDKWLIFIPGFHSWGGQGPGSNLFPDLIGTCAGNPGACLVAPLGVYLVTSGVYYPSYVEYDKWPSDYFSCDLENNQAKDIAGLTLSEGFPAEGLKFPGLKLNADGWSGVRVGYDGTSTVRLSCPGKIDVDICNSSLLDMKCAGVPGTSGGPLFTSTFNHVCGVVSGGGDGHQWCAGGKNMSNVISKL